MDLLGKKNGERPTPFSFVQFSYTVICDHYCGSGHGGMKMVIVVE